MTLAAHQTLLHKPNKEEYEQLLLRFLSEEFWSSEFNLCELFQLSPRTVKTLLKTITARKLIKHVCQDIMGGQVALYGITKKGLDAVLEGHSALWDDKGDKTQSRLADYASLMTSKPQPAYTAHKMDLQWLRIKAERSGWSNWINADHGQADLFTPRHMNSFDGRMAIREYRPDAWCTDPRGVRFSIECERTLKSKMRYSHILRDYLLALKRGDFDGVVWVCPNEELTHKLEAIITSMTHVQIGALEVLIPRSRFERFAFVSFDDWTRRELTIKSR